MFSFSTIGCILWEILYVIIPSLVRVMWRVWNPFQLTSPSASYHKQVNRSSKRSIFLLSIYLSTYLSIQVSIHLLIYLAMYICSISIYLSCVLSYLLISFYLTVCFYLSFFPSSDLITRVAGYLSLTDWPLLPFYGLMCGVYVVLGLLWFIFCSIHWRDILR